MKSWSAKNNSFFDTDQLERYVSAGWDLSDVTEIPDSLFHEYTVFPLGKCRVVVDGMPAWVNIPTPPALTSDELAAKARRYRDDFITATDPMMVSDYCIGDTQLTEAQRTALMEARTAYRSWPTVESWPLIELPELPQWLLIEAVNQGYRVPAWPPVF
ncbi:phage tail protein [Yersinia aldovae]|uniref:phage tail protein n=1 Tax=Yersinia aldovae TaxID=29483 RepID=UPI0011A20A17|nr:phage tail protein [Yersinia aldovae]